jgi:hypothetical protein
MPKTRAVDLQEAFFRRRARCVPDDFPPGLLLRLFSSARVSLLSVSTISRWHASLPGWTAEPRRGPCLAVACAP